MIHRDHISFEAFIASVTVTNFHLDCEEKETNYYPTDLFLPIEKKFKSFFQSSSQNIKFRDSYLKYSIMEGTKGVGGRKGGDKTKISQFVKAGLQFSNGRIKRYLKKSCYEKSTVVDY